MVSHGYEQEELRRQREGIKTLRWYKCHGCGAEYPVRAGVRTSRACSECDSPDIHIHSDLDGEKPVHLTL